MSLTKEWVLTCRISTGSYRAFLDELFKLSDTKLSSYVCFANVHMVVEAYRDKSFNLIVNSADVVAPDGKPVSIFLRLLRKVKQDRVSGMDILPDLLREAEKNGKSVYFYGTTTEVLDAISEKAKREFPKLKVCGLYSPPFRDLSQVEKTTIIDEINKAKPDFLLVALGCPKQEKWMAEHRNKIHACMLGLGQAFHVYAGLEKRLPIWMRDLSLEWAYRLYLEPRRLWKRYLITNTLFVYLTFKQLFKSSRMI